MSENIFPLEVFYFGVYRYSIISNESAAHDSNRLKCFQNNDDRELLNFDLTAVNILNKYSLVSRDEEQILLYQTSKLLGGSGHLLFFLGVKLY